MSGTDTSDEDDWAAALAEQRSVEAGSRASPTPNPYASASPAEMEAFQPTNDTGGQIADLDSILDIPVMMSVEIGKTKLSIRNLLQLNQGSVVELDRMAGEPLDVLINGTLVAHGEVVVVNEKFGIRLTDVVSAQERVKKLR
jgi:flagellar motor switch protein FliN/FliY